MLGGTLLTESGQLTISHFHEKQVWAQIHEVLDRKMGFGEFIVLDSCFQKTHDFRMPLQLAYKHRYEVACIDFTGVPIEECLKRNRQQEQAKQVSDHIIHRAYERFEVNAPPPRVEVLPHTLFETRCIKDYFKVPIVDLNHYKRIHHIGDIQGCFEPIATYFQDGFKDNEFYIFVGDFLDRGIENDKVINWVMQELVPRKNVVMIWGNHESHIHRYATKQKPVSKEFELNTWPQIKAGGFTRQQAHILCNQLVDCYMYTYNDKNVLVTHAGLSAVPQEPVLVPSGQYWKGFGRYNYPVDDSFSQYMRDTKWYQVHGHRNETNAPIQANDRSFNLEGGVEYGGYLRVLQFAQGEQPKTIEIPNTTYRQKELKTPSSPRHEKGKVRQATLAELEKSEFVSVQSFHTTPHIKAYNFTRKAFFKGAWNRYTLKARGLFVDNDRNIAARSYDKFFHLEERPETQLRNLETSLNFPLSLYVKENGYLGLVGYDAQHDDLFIASKSTPDGPHAKWFRCQLSAVLSEDGFAKLKEITKGQNVTLLFEVMLPQQDPHVIEYTHDHIVLIDAIYRDEEYKPMPYRELERLASQLGLTCKTLAMRFKTHRDLKNWLEGVEKQGTVYTYNGQHIEGFVAEDTSGYKFKIKLPYYNFWKQMRGLKERVLQVRKEGGPLRRTLDSPEAKTFYEWLNQQPDEMLEKNIVELRQLYVKS